MCVTINWPGAVPNSQEQGRARGKREFSLLRESESCSDSVNAKQSREGEGWERGSFHFYLKVKVVLILSSPNSQEQGRGRGRE